MKSIFKEWFECASQKEEAERWFELVGKGYHESEIYTFHFQGNDGKFHREIFVFKD